MNQQTVMETVFFVLLVFYFVLHDNFLIDNKIALLLKQIICNIILNDHWLTHCFPNWLLYLLGIKGQENKNTKTSCIVWSFREKKTPYKVKFQCISDFRLQRWNLMCHLPSNYPPKQPSPTTHFSLNHWAWEIAQKVTVKAGHN